MIEAGKPKFKCYPPIRERENSLLLLNGLKIGLFDHISSYYHDYIFPPHHSILSNLEEKNKDFRRGIAGMRCVGFTLQMLWTKLYS